MLTARRRQTTWAIAASTIAHLAVLVVVLSQRPTLPTPKEEGGPPEAIIPVLIMPRTPPPPPTGRPATPAPIRLHRRPQRFVPPEAPTAPIAPPTAIPAPGPAEPGTPQIFLPAPQPNRAKGDIGATLRLGAPGCANPLAAGLTRAERELCDEKFGSGAKTAAFPGLGLGSAKGADFDSAAQHNEACRAYRASPNGVQPPLRGGSC